MPEIVHSLEIPQREFTPEQERSVKVAFQCLQNTLEKLEVPDPTVRMHASDVRFLTTKEYKDLIGEEVPEDLSGVYSFKYAIVFTDRLPSDGIALTHMTLHEIIHGETHKRVDMNYPQKYGHVLSRMGKVFFNGMNESVVEHTTAFGINKHIPSKRRNKSGIEVYRKGYGEYLTVMDHIVSKISWREGLDESQVWRDLMKNQFLPNADFLFHVWNIYGKNGLLCLALLGADLEKDSQLGRNEREQLKNQRTENINSFFQFNNIDLGYIGFYDNLNRILFKECTLKERLSLLPLVNTLAKGCEMRSRGLRRRNESKVKDLGTALTGLGMFIIGMGICTTKPEVALAGGTFMTSGVGLSNLGEEINRRRSYKNLLLEDKLDS